MIYRHRIGDLSGHRCRVMGINCFFCGFYTYLEQFLILLALMKEWSFLSEYEGLQDGQVLPFLLSSETTKERIGEGMNPTGMTTIWSEDLFWSLVF